MHGWRWFLTVTDTSAIRSGTKREVFHLTQLSTAWINSKADALNTIIGHWINGKRWSKTKIPGKNHPSTTLLTTNHTQTGLDVTQASAVEMPATNHLTQDTMLVIACQI
jgi:hypothetical protein